MTSRTTGKDVLLVGSVPLDTSEEVFRAISESGIAASMPCLPDGEIGDRLWWIVMLSRRVFHGHPDIETLKRPAPIDGVPNWRAVDARDNWSFRVRPGVPEVHLEDPGWGLGYARDAANSYFVFKTLREKGIIPAGTRFQVSLPLTYSGMGSMFRDPSDWKVMVPAYEEAMRAELAKIFELIPPGDLAIQWDMAIELGMIERAVWETDTYWKDPAVEPLQLIGDAVARLSPGIPAETMLGYHLCYGTLGGWPMRHGKDLSMQVKCVDMMKQRAGRAVDFIHLPIIDRGSEEYFAPLKDMRAGDTKLYLGVIHNMTDLDDYKRKLAMAGRYLTDFGVAAPCGMGREAIGQVPQLLHDHRIALDLLNEARH